MEVKHKQAINLDNIIKQSELLEAKHKQSIDNMNKQLELMETKQLLMNKQLELMEAKQLELMEENRIDNESVNKNDSKDDELAVAQFGPGTE